MELSSESRIDPCPLCNEHHRGRGIDRSDRVLIAEDDPAIANLIAYNVERAGYEVTIAADGVEALRRLREDPPDLLILDLLLPLQSGWQVLREVRSRLGNRLARLPVLIVSALACDRLEGEIARMGAQRLLGKPFAVKDLCRAVGELLDATRTPTSPRPEADRIHESIIAHSSS
jgi:DNA-binding response OmpR family regulator